MSRKYPVNVSAETYQKLALVASHRKTSMREAADHLITVGANRVTTIQRYEPRRRALRAARAGA